MYDAVMASAPVPVFRYISEEVTVHHEAKGQSSEVAPVDMFNFDINFIAGSGDFPNWGARVQCSRTELV